MPAENTINIAIADLPEMRELIDALGNLLTALATWQAMNPRSEWDYESVTKLHDVYDREEMRVGALLDAKAPDYSVTRLVLRPANRDERGEGQFGVYVDAEPRGTEWGKTKR